MSPWRSEHRRHLVGRHQHQQALGRKRKSVFSYYNSQALLVKGNDGPGSLGDIADNRDKRLGMQNLVVAAAATMAA